MDTKTIRYLHELNNRFYQEQGASFARTRGAPWHGWKRCLEVLQQEGLTSPPAILPAEETVQNRDTLSVLDIASGNGRFESFLQESLPTTEINYFALDNSCEMASGSTFQNLDMLELLIDSTKTSSSETGTKAKECKAGESSLISNRDDALSLIPPADLCVSFGFMHHIPGQELRKSLIDLMLDATKVSGFVVISFWQFLKNADLAHKAKTTHKQALEILGTTPAYKDTYESADQLQAALDAGDYFLGWQDKEGAYRYCHSFSESEIDELATSSGCRAKLISRFSADGRTKNLNSYLILQKV